MTIVLKGPNGVERMSDAALSEYWMDLAIFLNGKMDPETRKLPAAYATAYELVRREFELRGYQLALF